MFDFRTLYELYFDLRLEREVSVLENKVVYGDNEYVIMSEIAENDKITQRELSKKMGISVSTVNVLINKMMREGLVKITQVSQKQVLYMLTPVGMMEKTKKTVNYLKIHYKVIYEMKRKLKKMLDELIESHDMIIVLLSEEPMWEIIESEIDRFLISNKYSSIQVIEDVSHIENNVMLNNTRAKSPVLLYLDIGESYSNIYNKVKNIRSINLAEWL